MCHSCCCSQSVSDVVSHGTLQLMEDSERESHVEDNSDEARSNASVETGNTVLSPDLAEAVGEALVLVRVDALHLSLDHIDGVVCHGGAESGEAT